MILLICALMFVQLVKAIMVITLQKPVLHPVLRHLLPLTTLECVLMFVHLRWSMLDTLETQILLPQENAF